MAAATTRRTLLGAAATLLAAARRGAAQQQISKAAARYQDSPHGQQRCEICVNFRPPNACRLVSGAISPQGWCQFFAARENAQ